MQTAEYRREWRKKNPLSVWYSKHKYRTENLDKAALVSKNYKNRVRAWVAEYKVTTGCADCGFNKHSAALSFHHIKGQKVTKVSVCWSIEFVKKEIEKCVLLCNNCHAIRHANEREALR